MIDAAERELAAAQEWAAESDVLDHYDQSSFRLSMQDPGHALTMLRDAEKNGEFDAALSRRLRSYEGVARAARATQ